MLEMRVHQLHKRVQLTEMTMRSDDSGLKHCMAKSAASKPTNKTLTVNCNSQLIRSFDKTVRGGALWGIITHKWLTA